MAKESPVALGNVTASVTCHSQPGVNVSAPASPQKHTVSSTNLNPNGVYTSEQVIALLAEAWENKLGTNNSNKEGWIEYKSRKTTKKECKLDSKTPKKRKFSPTNNTNEGCWICGKKGQFKNECPYMRCRFCKMLSHVIAECPTLSEKLRDNQMRQGGT